MIANARRGANQPATRRILDATRELVARGGAAEVSMGQVAQVAEVSKALVHYHFRDKESLLHALVDDVGTHIVRRAEAFMIAAEENVLDRYWSWFADELARGDVRILLALAEYDSARVRAAARRIAQQRRDVTGVQVTHIFARLGLAARVPPALMADTVLAFIDGMHATATLYADRDARPAFDILWLSLLTLAE